jgi:hypothetical protein
MSRTFIRNSIMKCGRCGQPLSYVHHKFRAPPKRDDRFWNVIRHLESAGQIRVLDRGLIPKNMREARALIRQKREDEIARSSPHKKAMGERKLKRRNEVERKRRLADKRRYWAKLARTGTSET